MKWYSVKKYRPTSSGYCFVRTIYGAIYSAEWRGGSDDGGADYSCGWMMSTLAEDLGAPEYVEIFGVTNFCIPDPVEIDDE